MTPGDNAGENIYYSHVRGHHYLAHASLMLGFGSRQGREMGERAVHRKLAWARPQAHYATEHRVSLPLRLRLNKVNLQNA